MNPHRIHADCAEVQNSQIGGQASNVLGGLVAAVVIHHAISDAPHFLTIANTSIGREVAVELPCPFGCEGELCDIAVSVSQHRPSQNSRRIGVK